MLLLCALAALAAPVECSTSQGPELSINAKLRKQRLVDGRTAANYAACLLYCCPDGREKYDSFGSQGGFRMHGRVALADLNETEYTGTMETISCCLESIS